MSNALSTLKRGLPHFVRWPRSLRNRLVLWNTLVLLLTLLVLGNIVYAITSYYLVTSVDKQLSMQATKLQNTARVWQASGQPFNAAFLDQLVRTSQGDEFTANVTSIKLFDPQNKRMLRRSPNLSQELLSLNINDFMAALHGQLPLNTYSDIAGRQVRNLTLAIRDKAQHILVIAQASQSLEGVRQVQSILVLVLIIGSICASLLACGISFWLTNRELRPLKALSASMLNLNVRRLGTHLSSRKLATEVQQLTESFNHMSDRLEASFTLQRTFIADVSHELRTPLTAIRGQIDVLLLNRALGEEERQDVQCIQAELGRLSRLVRNLLTDARAEVGLLPQVSQEPVEQVELDTLLIEIVHQVRFLNTRVALHFRQLQQGSVPGNRDLLKQLFLNLVDNALTYTPAGGSVFLELICTSALPEELKELAQGKQEQWAMVSVIDTGPGIDPTDLPHIFERHYRVSHSQVHGKLNSGLGLSIARLIAQAHSGTITVESGIGEGTCFSVWLPNCQEIMASASPL